MSDYTKLRRQLELDMHRAFEFFQLPVAVRKVARMAALDRLDSAPACYRAIVNSLPRGKDEDQK
jgi:hypothetical protein